MQNTVEENSKRYEYNERNIQYQLSSGTFVRALFAWCMFGISNSSSSGGGSGSSNW